MTADRPLTLPAILAVAGVSYRQDVVRRCRPGDTVAVIADPSNIHDPDAYAFVTADGTLLGYVPRTLTGRIAATGHDALAGEIVERLDGETTGLRVSVTGPVDGDVRPPSAPSSGDDPYQLTDRCDHDLDGADPAGTGPAGDDAGDLAAQELEVVARSGRVIGQYAGRSGRHVLIAASGRTITLPAAAVTVRPAGQPTREPSTV